MDIYTRIEVAGTQVTGNYIVTLGDDVITRPVEAETLQVLLQDPKITAWVAAAKASPAKSSSAPVALIMAR